MFGAGGIWEKIVGKAEKAPPDSKAQTAPPDAVSPSEASHTRTVEETVKVWKAENGCMYAADQKDEAEDGTWVRKELEKAAADATNPSHEASNNRSGQFPQAQQAQQIPTLDMSKAEPDGTEEARSQGHQQQYGNPWPSWDPWGSWEDARAQRSWQNENAPQRGRPKEKGKGKWTNEEQHPTAPQGSGAGSSTNAPAASQAPQYAEEDTMAALKAITVDPDKTYCQTWDREKGTWVNAEYGFSKQILQKVEDGTVTFEVEKQNGATLKIDLGHMKVQCGDLAKDLRIVDEAQSYLTKDAVLRSMEQPAVPKGHQLLWQVNLANPKDRWPNWYDMPPWMQKKLDEIFASGDDDMTATHHWKSPYGKRKDKTTEYVYNFTEMTQWNPDSSKTRPIRKQDILILRQLREDKEYPEDDK